MTASVFAFPADRTVGGRLLARARDLVTPALRKRTGRLPAVAGALAGYHFGWLEADGGPAEAPAGKAVRPALAFACAEAAGAAAGDAVDAAVAVELVHGFSLLHDDVIDQDALRRHRPAVWSVFGIPARSRPAADNGPGEARDALDEALRLAGRSEPPPDG